MRHQKKTSLPHRRPLHEVHQFARDVLRGKVVAPELVRRACEQHERRLMEARSTGVVFNEDEVDRAIDTLERFGCVPLSPWPRFLLAQLVGWQQRVQP
jgi:phage terminase large subunit-like protein